MKKCKLPFIVVFVSIAVFLVFVATHLFGVTRRDSPKDAFSEAVTNTTKESVILTAINVNSEDQITYYEFNDGSWTGAMKAEFVSALNDNIGLVNGKVCVTLWDGSGVAGRVFSVYNYYENESGFIMLDGFYRLNVSDIFIVTGMWGEPATYTDCFETINILEIPARLQEKADEQGVDWYDAWPELQEVIVYDLDM